MAITIKVEPQEIQPAYNEVTVVLDSDNKSKPKFQYVIDINVAGVFSSKIKVQSNPQGFGVLNLSKHLEPYVSYDLDFNNLSIFKEIGNSYSQFDVSLFEEYVLTTSFTTVTDNGGFTQYNYATPHNFVIDDFVTVSAASVPAYNGIQEVTSVPSTTAIVTTTVYSATAAGQTVLSNGTTTQIADPAEFTDDKYILNNVLKWRDVPTWNSDNYILDNILVGKFFTNLPSTMVTKLDDRFTFNFFFNSGEGITQTYLKVSTSNSETFYYDNILMQEFLSVGVGAYDLTNGTKSASVPMSAGDTIKDATEWYEVELVDLSLSPISEVKTFTIDRGCQSNYKIMYLNNAGSFTTFNFDLVHAKNVRANKTNYKKNYGSYNETANTYGWEASDRGQTRLDTDITEVHTINSDYVKEAYGDLIEDLIVSPEVYHMDDNVMRSIDITTNSVKIKQRKVDKLINYTISFEYSNKNTVQR